MDALSVFEQAQEARRKVLRNEAELHVDSLAK
jgi:hypothetical protein